MIEYLEVRQIDRKDDFVNLRSSWLPPDAQAIYGGTFVAQSLVSASKTIPEGFIPDSAHCSFILGGSPDTDIVYHVNRISTGEKMVVREVRAHQAETLVFMACFSFRSIKDHSVASIDISETKSLTMPQFKDWNIIGGGADDRCPYLCSRVEISHSERQNTESRTRQWIKSRTSMQNLSTKIHHVAALAYMSDNYFLPTTSRIRKIFWARDPEYTKGGQVWHESKTPTGHIKLMLSLDHIIYFHDISAYKADEWSMAEMESPWAGDGRTLVVQRIYSQDGTLVATVLQEGLFRVHRLNGKL